MKKGEIVSNNGTDYKLIKLIGEGGAGFVWQAQANNNNYAIKFIKSDDSNKNKIERFNKELTFCKNHPNKNIIPIIAEGKYNNGDSYYIMPYYSKTFRDIINKEKDADVLIRYILQLCNAVRFIQGKGVIHRDIKPENILINGKKLVLADFGIAHFKDSLLTKKSDLLVSRNYLAPEQKVKGNAKYIEKSADIYALGLIINECFTKQNPAGSSFKVIADDYPLFYELDTLVSNMIKQNQNERMSIDAIITEIKFIYGKIRRNLQEIKEDLSYDSCPQEINKKTLNKIFKQASEDILFAKTVFVNKSASEISKYNHNWHMKIGYCVDDFLFKLYMQEKIFDICKSKFHYESNVYRRNQTYNPLNLTDNEEHKRIYQQMKNIMLKYPLDNFDLSGKILKYFASCEDYHCNEILDKINNDFVNDVERNLLNTPILWIVNSLKGEIKENINSLIKDDEFNFEKRISINWNRTQDYENNLDETELFKNEDNEVAKILLEFQKRWKIIYNKVNDDYYSIKFKSYKQFDKFRKYALQLSKPYYIFEGDVLCIVNNYDYVNGIVEIKLSKIFDVPNPLAKILGLRTDY